MYKNHEKKLVGNRLNRQVVRQKMGLFCWSQKPTEVLDPRSYQNYPWRNFLAILCGMAETESNQGGL